MPELTGPIENPFRKFNNMTYAVSIYLQSPAHYAKMMETGVKDVKGMELLIQSAGASNEPGNTGLNDLGPAQPASHNFGAKRNKFFTRDFYIDAMQLQSYVAGTATGGPQNTFNFNFTVTEPNGFSFLNRLYNASVTYAKEELKIDGFNPINQIYLAVIRFYGYDKKGNPILNGAFDDGSDPESYIEKWIPFLLTDVRFVVESSKVVYSCKSACPQTLVGHGQVHGILPFNVGLQGATLEQLLGGEDKKVNSGGTVTQGLMAALNDHQKKLAATSPDGSPRRYEKADEYAIEFQEDAGLSDATLASVMTSSIARSGTAAAAAVGASLKAGTNSAKGDKGVKTQAGNTGMKIVKFIDLAIRSSSYMSDQYTKINDENKNNNTLTIPGPRKPLNWFKIRPRIEILQFDKLRAAWAYKITFVVTVYPVASVETKDFTSKQCFKTHKEYDYWFTGKNTEVLSFKQDFNSFYFTTFSAKHREDPASNPDFQNNARAQFAYRANSSEAHTGEGLGDEQAANAASILYAPQDQANCEIDIVGDPDWLSQSELFYGANKDPGEPILNDGSINYDRSEVYFSVNLNTVVDYNLDTGLADVTEKNIIENLDGSFAGGVSQYAFVYRANTITSQFEKGKFTQRLLGTVVFIPEACITGLDPNSIAGKLEIGFNNGKDPEQPTQQSNNNDFLAPVSTNVETNITNLDVGSKGNGFF